MVFSVCGVEKQKKGKTDKGQLLEEKGYWRPTEELCNVQNHLRRDLRISC